MNIEPRRPSVCQGYGPPAPKAMLPSRGLIIRQPWTEMILSGHKTWEIRGGPTHIRGPIAIIAAGSGKIMGVCTVTDATGPLTEETYGLAYRERGSLRFAPESLPYPQTFAWVMASPCRLLQPVVYEHPKGAVIWVRLSPATQQSLLAELERSSSFG